MRRRQATFLTAAMAGLTLLGSAGVATAASASDSTQEEVDAILVEHPGGVQTSKDSITWSNGVVLELDTGEAADEACPQDSMCLWADQNYTGRMVEIPGSLCGLGFIFNLKDYGFNDMASSWLSATRGLSNKYGTVWWDYDALGGKLWQMLPGFSAPTLPAEFNDEASSVTC
jgi:hypothetical protein